MPRRLGPLKTLWILFLAQLWALAYAGDYQIIKVEKGKSADVYFEINLSGKVYLSIHAPPGTEPCAQFWWIKWPFGNTEEVGRLCGSAALDIPGWTHLAVSAKLRIGGPPQPMTIVAAATEQVAHSVTISFP